jgi:hypothetical protein
MMQPCGFHTQDVEEEKTGFYALPECPMMMGKTIIVLLIQAKIEIL